VNNQTGYRPQIPSPSTRLSLTSSSVRRRPVLRSRSGPVRSVSSVRDVALSLLVFCLAYRSFSAASRTPLLPHSGRGGLGRSPRIACGSSVRELLINLECLESASFDLKDKRQHLGRYGGIYRCHALPRMLGGGRVANCLYTGGNVRCLMCCAML
jgi:hypothetical protein